MWRVTQKNYVLQTYCCTPDSACPKNTACRSLTKCFFYYLWARLIFSQASLWNAYGNQIRAGESASFRSCERKHWQVISLWLFWIQKQPVFLWINLASALFTAVVQKGKQKLLELVELHCIFCIHYTPCFDSKFSKLTDKKLLEIGFCRKVSVLRYFFLLSMVWALHRELNGSFRTIST